MTHAQRIALGWWCAGCTLVFKKPHGHPVLCQDCWDDLMPGDADHALRDLTKDFCGGIVPVRATNPEGNGYGEC